MKKRNGLNGHTWPASLMFAIVIQAGSLVWWAASLNTKVDNAVYEMRTSRAQDMSLVTKILDEIKHDLKIMQRSK